MYLLFLELCFYIVIYVVGYLENVFVVDYGRYIVMGSFFSWVIGIRLISYFVRLEV